MSNVKHDNIDIAIGNTVIDITFACENSGPFDKADASRHMHLFHEMHYIKHGNSYIENDFKEQFMLKSGDICVIPAGVYHSVKVMNYPLERTCVFFDISKKDDSNFDTYPCFFEVFSGSKIKVLSNTLPYFEQINSIFFESKKIDFVTKQKIKNLFSLIFIDFYEKNRDIYTGKANENLKYTGEVRLKIEEFFYNSPIDSMRLENLSSKLHLSTRQTDRLLKKYTGSCFRDIVAGIKMEKAKELISTVDISLKSIASQLGYSSYAGFCNSFKKAVGVTPLKYKQNLKI